MRARRLLLACVTCLLLMGAVAQDGEDPAPDDTRVGDPFASLVITSHGRQSYDITTGLTTLPDGGRLFDAKTGVEVEAAVIRFVDGEYVEASGVSVGGEFGDFQAESMRIDLVNSVLTATGQLRLNRDGLTVTAGTLKYFANGQVMVFEDGVEGTEPAFFADRLLLDVVTGDVLLDGKYTYAGDLFTMRSPEAGGRLQLSLENQGEQVVYAAATEVSPALLERFRAYL